ncbi:MAG: hypothetical protein ABMA01_14510 [Chthoniobacteraceae bacterium]
MLLRIQTVQVQECSSSSIYTAAALTALRAALNSGIILLLQRDSFLMLLRLVWLHPWPRFRLRPPSDDCREKELVNTGWDTTLAANACAYESLQLPVSPFEVRRYLFDICDD